MLDRVQWMDNAIGYQCMTCGRAFGPLDYGWPPHCDCHTPTSDNTLAGWVTEPRHVTSCPEEVAVTLARAANFLRANTTSIDQAIARYNRDHDPRVSRLIFRLVRYH